MTKWKKLLDWLNENDDYKPKPKPKRYYFHFLSGDEENYCIKCEKEIANNSWVAKGVEKGINLGGGKPIQIQRKLDISLFHSLNRAFDKLGYWICLDCVLKNRKIKRTPKIMKMIKHNLANSLVEGESK